MPFPEVWEPGPVSPNLPANPEEAVIEYGRTEPMCFQCRRVPPMKLPHMGRYGDTAAFCSERCAALAGLQFFRESEYVLCDCGLWSDVLGYCPVCDSEVSLADRHDALMQKLDPEEKEGVSHDA